VRCHGCALSANHYLAGAEYSIADIITWLGDASRAPERRVAVGDVSNVKRWVEELRARPRVERGFTSEEWRDRQRTRRKRKKARGPLQPDQRLRPRGTRGGGKARPTQTIRR